jgi:Ca2+-transporting ATPase
MMVNETRDSPTIPELVAAPHTLAVEEVAARLGVQRDFGLTSQQARERRVQYGPNRLSEALPRSAWLVFFGQFKSILIFILIGAALLSALIGSVKDAIVILAVVVINAVVGFYQEYRAERSLTALKEMLPAKTRVRREGEKHEIAAEDLVPGDVVLLEEGDRVPADGRLFIAAGLEIDESALTGESRPVGKQTAALKTVEAPLGDRVNMAFLNSVLARGRAELIVTATGVHTEMGLSQELAAAEEVPSPLQIQLDRLGRRLGAALTLVPKSEIDLSLDAILAVC